MWCQESDTQRSQLYKQSHTCPEHFHMGSQSQNLPSIHLALMDDPVMDDPVMDPQLFVHRVNLWEAKGAK